MKNNNVLWMKKRQVFIIIFMINILLIIVPILINIMFKIEAPFAFLESEWNPGDYLLYVGGFSASLTTIVAVYITLKADYKKELENKRFSILPYFIITKLDIKSYKNIFSFKNEVDSDDKEDSFELYKINKLYVVIKDGTISYFSNLEKEKLKLIKTGGYHWIEKNRSLNLVKEGLLILPLVFENIGNGTAIMVTITFYNTEESKKYVHLQSLKQNESIELFVYLENAKDTDIGEYFIELGYKDIYGNAYKQKYQVDVVIDIEGRYGIVVNLEQPSVDSTQILIF